MVPQPTTLPRATSKMFQTQNVGRKVLEEYTTSSQNAGSHLQDNTVSTEQVALEVPV
jgi:hypothetical protein